MHYYEVWVSSQRYHSDKPLTYSYDLPLETGSIVTVPLQRQTVVAVVIRTVPKPSFPTKNILSNVDADPLPAQSLELLVWLAEYYPAPMGQLVSLILPSILTSKSRNATEETGSSNEPKSLPPLTAEQQTALQRIHSQQPKSIMLHGDTGTGKTRIYMELAKEMLNQGRSTVLLTPEIGLTPQLALTFQETFPGRVVVMHSDLTPAARRNVWLHINKSEHPLIVIGPRSALFTPLKNIGMVIMDECHEPSYKQEQAPHYLASRVAAKLAALHGAQLILGSATPPISDYFAFREKNLPIIRMTEPAKKHDFGEPTVHIVDIKTKELFSRSPWLSDKLIEALEVAFKNNQQSLVFLNRRGTARLVLCQICGWQAFCPNCDLPLTYHADTHLMQCHTCGHAQKTPSACPDCSSNDIIFRSIGTKSIVAEIAKLVPGARIARFDSDTAKSERLEAQYASVKEGSVDILVGTQMLGKGLDLPKLAVVGIATAETSLTFPDYTSEERTYQLITQALGRVNRGHMPGTAIVQTHHPDSPLLQAAVSKNYGMFYEQQIAERQLYKFPPFRHLLKLTCARASSSAAKKASEEFAQQLRRSGRQLEIIGPNPAFTEKTHNKYHWQIVLRATKRQLLVDVIKELPANWSYDIDPMNLL